MNLIEKWDVFELRLDGPTEGNPFIDVIIGARFSFGCRHIDVDGFYDGKGQYVVRFMPDAEGLWRYKTRSGHVSLDEHAGTFECLPPGKTNHGPLRVHNRFHFAHEDGTRHQSFGTTCYVWNHQGNKLEEQTLKTLANGPFNKIRMCVFPKHYAYNRNEPRYHPFEGSIEDGWDFTRFNPPFWAHLEQRILDLRDLGIEADLILFHPYDRWGYAELDAEVDDRYLTYAVARLSAFRNLWWSFANEYDLMKSKTEADWDRYFKIVQSKDPVQHLRGIHNCRQFYDHGKPWVTHCSIQRPEPSLSKEWREQYGKPVVIDECRYEGNVNKRWGNITAQEMVRKFWDGTCSGGYVGHGETYLHPDDVLWWSKGGVLRGKSGPRIQFLRDIVEAGPPNLNPVSIIRGVPTVGVSGEYYLAYTGNSQSASKDIKLPECDEFKIEIIDTWEMKITPLKGIYSGACTIDLPTKPYIALRFVKV
ncbi:MAG: DUF5060 domain-containing protein [Candidatus Latescibacterota bacterium]|nr:DUF5060 domain-containing protein [Candidatus Latescibacterota bacterium]